LPSVGSDQPRADLGDPLALSPSVGSGTALSRARACSDQYLLRAADFAGDKTRLQLRRRPVNHRGSTAPAARESWRALDCDRARSRCRWRLPAERSCRAAAAAADRHPRGSYRAHLPAPARRGGPATPRNRAVGKLNTIPDALSSSARARLTMCRGRDRAQSHGLRFRPQAIAPLGAGSSTVGGAPPALGLINAYHAARRRSRGRGPLAVRTGHLRHRIAVRSRCWRVRAATFADLRGRVFAENVPNT